jgi:putative hydrolase
MNSSMVDWDLAVTTGRKLVKPGPTVTPDEARAAVTQLKAFAVEAHGHVAGFTGLTVPDDHSNGASVVVVDRPGWIQANAAGFRTVLEPLIEKIQEKRPTSSAMGDAVGSKVTGVQTGSLLAFLATKVLGQYELFPPYGADPETTPGRLLLVAPNIVSAELIEHL